RVLSHMHWVTMVDISHNNMSVHCAGAIVIGASRIPALKSLYIGGNCVGRGAGAALLPWIHGGENLTLAFLPGDVSQGEGDFLENELQTIPYRVKPGHSSCLRLLCLHPWLHEPYTQALMELFVHSNPKQGQRYSGPPIHFDLEGHVLTDAECDTLTYLFETARLGATCSATGCTPDKDRLVLLEDSASYNVY
ncbi:hypothetical protein KIPB_005706, partial [Kipferlia bialata]